eukprot:CAMPEP_0178921802 /NCGR_PEP_ID=MMETSP0786-20121207/15772_1 /TAXON_ID=186022 /ORGANISM="Thalassionema frauenfeldii, Strain CCMP 1798" /LENGTH=455 /DNA_ID=CAMNT_0020596039 /DNA_START=189 /DNA_END=1556 /DNA_ORIENTATION=+
MAIFMFFVSLYEASRFYFLSLLYSDEYSHGFTPPNSDGDIMDPILTYTKEMDLSKVPPKGSPPNLPAEKVDEQEVKEISRLRARDKYGGFGEKSHLGGFTTLDIHGISPFVWRDMMEYFGVKKLLDVGCGRGVSTSWFYMQGVHVQCVEGSHDAIERNILPGIVKKADKLGIISNYSRSVTAENVIVEHDFSLGPWWPEETVDAVWCVELLEHVSRNFAPNYFAAFKKSALIFASHSTWGGWHHTEVHDADWWIAKFEMLGFIYSESMTKRIRYVTRKEMNAEIPFPIKNDQGTTYLAQHIPRSMKVFINPLVASRPQHAHLLAEGGCFDSTKEKGKESIQCGDESHPSERIINSRLPEEFLFIPYKEENHIKWEEELAKSVAEDKIKQRLETFKNKPIMTAITTTTRTDPKRSVKRTVPSGREKNFRNTTDWKRNCMTTPWNCRYPKLALIDDQ